MSALFSGSSLTPICFLISARLVFSPAKKCRCPKAESSFKIYAGPVLFWLKRLNSAISLAFNKWLPSSGTCNGGVIKANTVAAGMAMKRKIHSGTILILMSVDLTQENQMMRQEMIIPRTYRKIFINKNWLESVS